MMMTLKVRFNGENNLWWNCVPLADQTKSGIPTRMWIGRILYRQCGLEKQERGLLFSIYNRIKATIVNFDPMLKNLLERGQNLQLELLTTGVSIVYFSLRRFPRRGATTEAENNNVDTVDIELINWWWKRKSNSGTEAGLLVRQVYTQVSRSIVAAICFSRSH